MTQDKDFALLVGRAFLHEIDAGHKDSAIAFGRAFLLALGMRGPEESVRDSMAHGKHYGEGLATALN